MSADQLLKSATTDVLRRTYVSTSRLEAGSEGGIMKTSLGGLRNAVSCECHDALGVIGFDREG